MNQKINILDQEQVDNFLNQLDGTTNKSKLGANAILGVSLAAAVAAASYLSIPLYRHIANLCGSSQISLPIPAFNIINGGSHAGNGIAFQEFMVMPVGAKNFSEAMKMGSEIYQNLKSIIKKKFGQDGKGDLDMGWFLSNF
jgi:enolase